MRRRQKVAGWSELTGLVVAQEHPEQLNAEIEVIFVR